MAFEATVVIGTYGAERWVRLARERAAPSVPDGVPVIHMHRDTLAQARNAALEMVQTEWVIGLDADDELSPDYIDRMAEGSADMRAPAVQHFRAGLEWGLCRVPAVYGHDHLCTVECMRYGNWMCIGTAVRTELAQAVRWEEFGWSEDYAFFARIVRAGATAEAIPAAIYRAHHDRKGRNQIPIPRRNYWHRQIEAAVWPDEPSVL